MTTKSQVEERKGGVENATAHGASVAKLQDVLRQGEFPA